MQLKVGNRVRTKIDIWTYFSSPYGEYGPDHWRQRGQRVETFDDGSFSVLDASAGDIGEVVMTYDALSPITCKWPLIISDVHPDEVELLQ